MKRVIYEKQNGVPAFEETEYMPKQSAYVVLIPVLNEGKRLHRELFRAQKYGVSDCADIVICDGGSSDDSVEDSKLKKLGVNTRLVKTSDGRQGTQLRMGIWWALHRGYQGIVTIDGNNKDSIEDVPKFIEKLENGYDFVQGSRFVPGGRGIRTPFIREVAVRFLHAPIISLTAHYRFTDSTNGFRAYSAGYLTDHRVQPLREIFVTYELLAYLSVRASQIGLKVCEIPVARVYPKGGKVPTKISFFKGNGELLKILVKNALGCYKP